MMKLLERLKLGDRIEVDFPALSRGRRGEIVQVYKEWMYDYSVLLDGDILPVPFLHVQVKQIGE